MAKPKNNVAPETSSIDDPFARLRKTLEAPEDFKERAGDLVGYWEPELSPIQCKPLGAKLFDGSIEKDKPSVLITVELTKPCAVNPPKDSEAGDKPFIAPEGSLVGVWYKPGMRAIRNLCGVDVNMKIIGEKDTGKPSPMKLYSVTSASNGIRLPVTEDTRDKSAHAKTDFDMPGRRSSNGELPPLPSSFA